MKRRIGAAFDVIDAPPAKRPAHGTSPGTSARVLQWVLDHYGTRTPHTCNPSHRSLLPWQTLTRPRS